MSNEISMIQANYHHALLRLQAALKNELDEDGICIDATLHRFEVCFGLAMKLLKAMIAYEGIEVDSYRSAIREGWKQGMLTDAEAWLDMYEKSKMTMHNYDESLVIVVYRLVNEKYLRLLLAWEEESQRLTTLK